jgi:hypothetical protein
MPNLSLQPSSLHPHVIAASSILASRSPFRRQQLSLTSNHMSTGTGSYGSDSEGHGLPLEGRSAFRRLLLHSWLCKLPAHDVVTPL